MAMNKQQALAQKRKRDTSYGAEPGEITKGLKPGDRYYDLDTNTWQLREPNDDVSSYIDQVLQTSGMTNVQGSPKGDTGAGSSSGRKSSEANNGDEANPEQAVQDALNKGISLEQIATGAIGGAATVLIAQRLLKARSKGGGPANPAADTAGVADAGGTGAELVDGKPSLKGDLVVNGTFEDMLGLPSPMKQIAGPQQSQANPDIAEQLRLPPSTNPIDQSILETEDGSSPLADPELERALQQYAQQMAGTGDPTDLQNAMRPSLHPDLPMMDEAISRRLRAIIAGMM